MKHTKNVIYLLIAVLIWGTAFLAQKSGGDALGAFAFNGIRNLIGALVLVPVVFALDKMRKETYHFDKAHLKAGVICGVALCVASNLQQVGITMGASMAKAGFLTSIYILLIPIVGFFLGKGFDLKVFLGVIMAMAGLYLLCFTEGMSGFAKADLMLILCAVGFTVQILCIDYFAPSLDPVRMSCIEFLVCGILSSIISFIFEMGGSVSGLVAWSSCLSSQQAWISILYAGVLSSGVAYTLQIAGQKNFNPSIAALIMSGESAISAIAGWAVLGEKLSIQELIGCIIIFAAIIVAQLPSKQTK